MKEAPFAILHGGIITGISGQIPGKIILEIECQYLRERHSAPGDTFFIELKDCRKLFFTDDLKTVTRSFQSILHQKPEMLSADTVGSEVHVFCANGTLHIECKDVTVYLNQSDAISVDDLEKIARDYWDDWEEQAKKNPVSGRHDSFLS